MDPLSISIIVIATLLAIVFKWFLFVKIRNWMDADLIKGLSAGDTKKQEYLAQQLIQLKADGCKRSQIHQQLTECAEKYELNAK